MDALLARIAVGDQEAMRELYLECRPRLWRYLAHLDGVDATMLDDLLQEIFVAIWRSAPSYRPQGSALAWIYAIARHHASHARRDSVRRAEHTHRAGLDGESFETGRDHEAPFENGVLTRLALDDALARSRHRIVRCCGWPSSMASLLQSGADSGCPARHGQEPD